MKLKMYVVIQKSKNPIDKKFLFYIELKIIHKKKKSKSKYIFKYWVLFDKILIFLYIQVFPNGMWHKRWVSCKNQYKFHHFYHIEFERTLM